MPGSAADLPSVAEVIEAALPTARWFAGKHRRAQVRAIVGLPAISDDDLPVVSLEIAEVIDPDAEGPAEHYLLPLCYRSPSDPAGPGLGVARHPRWGPVAVHEASTDPYAGDVFLQLLSTPTDLTEDPHLLRCRVLDTSSLRPGLPARAFGGEQSNTSVLYADRALLKFFRRLEFGGENLDIEVHRELAGGPARGRLAGLMSWLSAEWIDSTGHARAADLGMLVEQVRGAADGWDLAVDQVLRGADFSAYAAELGHALRDVHTGLADAFGTETVPGAATSAAMRNRLVDAIAEVDELAPLHGALDSRLAWLGDHDQTVQRVHGDFHLGQTLLARGEASPGWRIIDFEGEPLKSLAERREPDTVWRDVAGLLRSFDYAGAFATRTGEVQPDVAAEWVAASKEAFLLAYAGRPLTASEQHVLQAYEIDKAIYECRYEKRNRPDWLPIPLGALVGLVNTPAASAADKDLSSAPHEGGNHGR